MKNIRVQLLFIKKLSKQIMNHRKLFKFERKFKVQAPTHLGSRIPNFDETKMKRCIPILMVPLDSSGNPVLLASYTTSCRFSEVVDFQARWIGLGRSWIFRVDPVFLKSEAHLKYTHRTGTQWNIETQSKSSPCGRFWF